MSQNTTTGKRKWYCMNAAAPILSVPWKRMKFIYHKSNKR
jgi:hypothetical protein